MVLKDFQFSSLKQEILYEWLFMKVLEKRVYYRVNF